MKLRRQLGLYELISISSGAMLSGLFILPGLAYSITGPSLLVSYVLAALLAVTGMLSQAELASAMPKAGGAYFFVSRSMGPSVGAVYGLITWLSLCLKSAVELTAVSIFASMFIDTDMHLIAMAFCVVFLLINLIGIREAGWIQKVLVTAIVSAVIVYVVKGVSFVDVTNYTPFNPGGTEMIISAAGFIFVSFGGLLKIASIAEEVKDPATTMHKGMIASLVITGIIYLGAIFITIGVSGSTGLDGNLTPISLGAGIVSGPIGVFVFHLVAILAILTAANAGIMAASRYPFALGRDGLLPGVFSKVNKVFNTPHSSIFISGGLIIAALFFDLNVIIKAASSVLILTYVFSCISVIIMRESHVQNYRPHFFSPFYPWIQIAGIIGLNILLFQTGLLSVVIGALVIGAGILLHWYYIGTGVNREYALLHLIERVSQRRYTDHILETELKHIIHERDNILKDNFDLIIEECIVQDIDSKITKEDFFEIVADNLAEPLQMSDYNLKMMLMGRENESSTVLSPFLAIPHVIVPGKSIFKMLIARSKKGITFNPDFQKVHAVFVLIGSRDTRPMHLQSLAAIAQIFQDPEFEQRWLSAKDGNSLKDIILLSKRKRQVPDR